MTNQQQERAARLARQFYGRVKSKLPRRVLNRLSVEDMEQEALLAVLQCGSDLRLDSASFLKTVVFNHLRDYLASEYCIADTETEFVWDEEGEPTFKIADDSPFSDPAERAAMNEVLAAVDSLPANQRHAVRGILDNRTHEDMSRDCGISRQAMSLRQSAGLQSLRLCLGAA